MSRTLQPDEKVKSGEYYSRWVYFPSLIESCGTVQRQKPNLPPNCSGDICLRQMGYGCGGDVETIPNVCSSVPDRNPAGDPIVM